MKILLVTEKYNPNPTQRDGGARVVDTLKESFGESLEVMQFGQSVDHKAQWSYDYPFLLENRFERRIANAEFIINCVKEVEGSFTHILFIHLSMQFGIARLPLKKDLNIWTFPMFLTPSYRASGEYVPQDYFKLEQLALQHSHNILTPSHLERSQLINLYGISQDRIHLVPRGINAKLLDPAIRCLKGPPKFCSVGSIKPQKNTIGLVQLFKLIELKYPDATLNIIGPIQDSDYYKKLKNEIQRLGLKDRVKLSGPVLPQNLSDVLKGYHIHLSCSNCETFGRSIFETLALGLPNIARKSNNAAAEFLNGLPYAFFTDDPIEALGLIDEVLLNLRVLSSLAIEVGRFYNDAILAKLLTAKIMNEDILAISDFDGTLFHKNDSKKTQQSIEAFRKFPVKVICSARPLTDLLEKLDSYNLKVDWIISYSGCVIADGLGHPLHISFLSYDQISELVNLIPSGEHIEYNGNVIQMRAPKELLPNLPNFRLEIYQGMGFIMNWEASKFRAIHWLLQKINWCGQVRAFGDGIYDAEFLAFYGGDTIGTFDEDLKIRELING
jgi:glycosyltransferase involved in cell wall biosynthesis